MSVLYRCPSCGYERTEPRVHLEVAHPCKSVRAERGRSRFVTMELVDEESAA